MKKVMTVVLALPGLLFTFTGIRWLVDPAGGAEALGMDLLEGLGRSSQIGDFASFFLVLGICVLAGVASRQRYWFYPAAMLLAFAAFSRTLAWLIHDAALASQFIVFEIVVACLLFFGSGFLTREDDPQTQDTNA